MNVFYMLLLFVCVIFLIRLLLTQRTQIDQASTFGTDFYINTSKIEGIGVFTKRARAKGEKLFVAINADKTITPIGSKINHCPSKTMDDGTSVIPNTYVSNIDTTTGEWWIIAVRDIKAGEELTADYTNTPDFIAKPDPDWKCPK